MNARRGKLVSRGRLQVPADIRRALGIADGDPLLLRVVDGALRVNSVHNALGRVQARLRTHIPPEISLSDELIDDRRAAYRATLAIAPVRYHE